MSAVLRDWLAGSRDWGRVVHLGAGDGRVWRAERTVPARRVVLVEGDARAAARLRSALQGRTAFQALERVVAPKSGDARWYEHDVDSFDGLVRHDRDDRALLFPRLRCTGHRTVAARALTAVLEECLADAAADDPAVLVVDLPLTGTPWLPASAAATLARFRRVVVTKAAAPSGNGEAPPALAPALAAAGFLRVPGTQAGATSFAFDEVAWRVRREQERLAGVETDLALLRAARQEGLVDLGRTHQRVLALEGEVRRLREKHATTEQQHIELRQAISRAEGALRALDPLLRPDGGGSAS